MAELASQVITAVAAVSAAGITAIVGSRVQRFTQQSAERQQERDRASLERQHVRQEQTQERTQVRELRAEHQKWRRDRRQAAYQAFLDATYTSKLSLRAFFHAVHADEFHESTARDKAQAAWDAVAAAEQAHTAVLLEGPSGVATLADAYQDCLYGLHDLVRAHLTIRAEGRDNDHNMGRFGERWREKFGERITAHDAFLQAARSALDELMAPQLAPPVESGQVA